jgi:hypothetical protein
VKVAPEVMAEFRKRIDKKKLNKYLKKYLKRIKLKVDNALLR